MYLIFYREAGAANAGNLIPRLIYRLNDYNECKTHSFVGDAYDNEDYIEDNEELIQLLKDVLGKVVQDTMILKDKRHGK